MKRVKILCLLLALIFTAIFLTGCAGDPIDKTWFDTKSDIPSTMESTYPYDQKTLTNYNAVIFVGFDKIFGVSRALVRYRGEIPYTYAYDEDGKAHEGLEDLPYTSSISGKQLTKDDPLWKDYWGDITLSDEASVEELEKVNAEKIISLRLYAQQTSSATNWFGNIGYTIFKAFAQLGSMLCNLVITIKNINIMSILDALGLDELTKVVNNVLIAERDDSGHIVRLSPFAVIAIIAFCISLVGFVINYIKGNKKEKGLWTDIILIALAGLLIVGIAISNNAVRLGSMIADLSTKLTSALVDTGTGTQMWKTETTSIGSYEANLSQDLQSTETSMINKSLIDMEICAQFGVKAIDELNFDALGDTDFSLAKKYLTNYKHATSEVWSVPSLTGSGVASMTDIMRDRIGNNLGYYFWYADTPNQSYGYPFNNPTVIFLTNNAQTDKLDQMITYLQACYNKAIDSNDSVKQENIKNIIEHFANPAPGGAIINMILLLIIYILLALCLFKYAFKIVMAKLSLLVGILALPVSGILIVTTNKKLVQTGKGLFGIFVMAFIKITVFSIFFDLIIFVAGALITTEIIRLLITGVLLFLMWKLNPSIEKVIDDLLDKVERTIAPEALQMKRSAKQFARRKIRDAHARVAAHGKIIGYDASGNEIRQSSKGNILDQALSVADNMLTDDPASKRSLRQITRDAKNDRKAAANQAREGVISAADTLRANEYQAADRRVNDIIDNIENDAHQEAEEMRTVNDDGTVSYNEERINEAGLTNELNELRRTEVELDELRYNDRYKELRSKTTLTDTEQEELDSYRDRVYELESKKHRQEIELRQRIDQYTKRNATIRYRDELEEALNEKQEAAINVANNNGESVIDRTGIRRQGRLSQSDFAHVAETQRQIDLLDRAIAGEVDITDRAQTQLSREEMREVTAQYEQYLQDNNLLGHGTRRDQRRDNDRMFDVNVQTTIRNRDRLRNKNNTTAETETEHVEPTDETTEESYDFLETVMVREPGGERISYTDEPEVDTTTESEVIEPDVVEPEIVDPTNTVKTEESTGDYITEIKSRVLRDAMNTTRYKYYNDEQTRNTADAIISTATEEARNIYKLKNDKITYNEELLTEDEKQLLNEARNTDAQLDSNSDITKTEELREQSKKQWRELKDKVDSRIVEDAYTKHQESEATIIKHTDGDATDDVYKDAVQSVIATGVVSATMLQRKFKVGYHRAQSLIDTMEKENIISKPDRYNNNKRKVLMTDVEYQERFAPIDQPSITEVKSTDKRVIQINNVNKQTIAAEPVDATAETSRPITQTTECIRPENKQTEPITPVDRITVDNINEQPIRTATTDKSIVQPDKSTDMNKSTVDAPIRTQSDKIDKQTVETKTDTTEQVIEPSVQKSNAYTRLMGADNKQPIDTQEQQTTTNRIKQPEVQQNIGQQTSYKIESEVDATTEPQVRVKHATESKVQPIVDTRAQQSQPIADSKSTETRTTESRTTISDNNETTVESQPVESKTQITEPKIHIVNAKLSDSKLSESNTTDNNSKAAEQSSSNNINSKTVESQQSHVVESKTDVQSNKNSRIATSETKSTVMESKTEQPISSNTPEIKTRVVEPNVESKVTDTNIQQARYINNEQFASTQQVKSQDSRQNTVQERVDVKQEIKTDEPIRQKDSIPVQENIQQSYKTESIKQQPVQEKPTEQSQYSDKQSTRPIDNESVNRQEHTYEPIKQTVNAQESVKQQTQETKPINRPEQQVAQDNIKQEPQVDTQFVNQSIRSQVGQQPQAQQAQNNQFINQPDQPTRQQVEQFIKQQVDQQTRQQSNRPETQQSMRPEQNTRSQSQTQTSEIQQSTRQLIDKQEAQVKSEPQQVVNNTQSESKQEPVNRTAQQPARQVEQSQTAKPEPQRTQSQASDEQAMKPEQSTRPQFEQSQATKSEPQTVRPDTQQTPQAQQSSRQQTSTEQTNRSQQTSKSEPQTTRAQVNNVQVTSETNQQNEQATNRSESQVNRPQQTNNQESQVKQATRPQPDQSQFVKSQTAKPESQATRPEVQQSIKPEQSHVQSQTQQPSRQQPEQRATTEQANRSQTISQEPQAQQPARQQSEQQTNRQQTAQFTKQEYQTQTRTESQTTKPEPQANKTAQNQQFVNEPTQIASSSYKSVEKPAQETKSDNQQVKSVSENKPVDNESVKQASSQSKPVQENRSQQSQNVETTQAKSAQEKSTQQASTQESKPVENLHINIQKPAQSQGQQASQSEQASNEPPMRNSKPETRIETQKTQSQAANEQPTRQQPSQPQQTAQTARPQATKPEPQQTPQIQQPQSNRQENTTKTEPQGQQSQTRSESPSIWQESQAATSTRPEPSVQQPAKQETQSQSLRQQSQATNETKAQENRSQPTQPMKQQSEQLASKPEPQATKPEPQATKPEPQVVEPEPQQSQASQSMRQETQPARPQQSARTQATNEPPMRQQVEQPIKPQATQQPVRSQFQTQSGQPVKPQAQQSQNNQFVNSQSIDESQEFINNTVKPAQEQVRQPQSNTVMPEIISDDFDRPMTKRELRKEIREAEKEARKAERNEKRKFKLHINQDSYTLDTSEFDDSKINDTLDSRFSDIFNSNDDLDIVDDLNDDSFDE